MLRRLSAAGKTEQKKRIFVFLHGILAALVTVIVETDIDLPSFKFIAQMEKTVAVHGPFKRQKKHKREKVEELEEREEEVKKRKKRSRSKRE